MRLRVRLGGQVEKAHESARVGTRVHFVRVHGALTGKMAGTHLFSLSRGGSQLHSFAGLRLRRRDY